MPILPERLSGRQFYEIMIGYCRSGRVDKYLGTVAFRGLKLVTLMIDEQLLSDAFRRYFNEVASRLAETEVDHYTMTVLKDALKKGRWWTTNALTAGNALTGEDKILRNTLNVLCDKEFEFLAAGMVCVLSDEGVSQDIDEIPVPPKPGFRIGDVTTRFEP